MERFSIKYCCYLTIPIFLFYNLISFAQQEILFEEFIDNRNGWLEGNNEFAYYRIENGQYVFTCKLQNKNRKKAYFVAKYFPFEETEDFVIETRITKIDGNNKIPYGVHWGRDLRGNWYSFGITGEGSFFIHKYLNYIPQNITKKKRTNIINKGNSTNTLKIKHVHNNWKFYANDNFLAEIPSKDFFGDYIGFSVGNNQKIAIDNLSIFAIKADTIKDLTHKSLKTIEVRGQNLDKSYFYEGEKLNYKKLHSLLKNDTLTRSKVQSAQACAFFGNFFLYTGGLLIGYPLGQWIGSKIWNVDIEPYWWMAGAGGGCLLLGIGFGILMESSISKAVEIYNNNQRKNQMLKTSIKTKMTSDGITLSFNF